LHFSCLLRGELENQLEMEKALMKKRVLIVDEEASFRKPLAEALTDLGCEALEVGDAFEAFKVVSSLAEEGKSVDLLVAAIQLSVVSGVELLDRLEEHGHSPAVVFTSYFMDESLFAGLMRRQCVDFLEQPVPPEEAAARIFEILGRNGKTAPPSRAVFRRKGGDELIIEWNRSKPDA
jgi:CheY-like chemotaxis protein